MPELIVEADGGSRGNPGVAGAGALVRHGRLRETRSKNHPVLDAIAVPLGTHATNNVAEYQGLIAGLRMAAAIDDSAGIEVRLDSKLVVEQMAGRWKIKHPDMQDLAGLSCSLAGSITEAGGSVNYAWVPRKQNTDADDLSNEAMDCAAAGTSWSKEASTFCRRLAISSEQNAPAGPQRGAPIL